MIILFTRDDVGLKMRTVPTKSLLRDMWICQLNTVTA